MQRDVLLMHTAKKGGVLTALLLCCAAAFAADVEKIDPPALLLAQSGCALGLCSANCQPIGNGGNQQCNTYCKDDGRRVGFCFTSLNCPLSCPGANKDENGSNKTQ